MTKIYRNVGGTLVVPRITAMNRLLQAGLFSEQSPNRPRTAANLDLLTEPPPEV